VKLQNRRAVQLSDDAVKFVEWQHLCFVYFVRCPCNVLTWYSYLNQYIVTYLLTYLQWHYLLMLILAMHIGSSLSRCRRNLLLYVDCSTVAWLHVRPWDSVSLVRSESGKRKDPSGRALMKRSNAGSTGNHYSPFWCRCISSLSSDIAIVFPRKFSHYRQACA